VATSAFQSPTAGVDDRRWLVLALGAPALVAWGLLWWWGSSPVGHWFRHDDRGGHPILLLVLVGWVVMIAAMMLPTTAPLLRVFVRIIGHRAHRHRLVWLLIAGYASVWTLVGAVAIIGDSLVHRVVNASSMLSAHPRLVAGTVFLLAGAYQFTPLKKRCLTSCRSPFLFVAQRWRGRDDRWESYRLGIDHGWYCVGCCWSLMLLMFAVGMANVGFMLLLATVMGVEKNVARAHLLGPLLGVGLFATSVVIFASA
jgi:predicted metal-binding membrane protein